MDGQPHPVSGESLASPESAVAPPAELSLAERKARRLFIISLTIAGLFLVGLIVLLVFLSIDAYHAGGQPTPATIVTGLLRDAAIIFVAFETLIIGILLIILMVQVQSLVVLLRDEIRPILETANETLTTVRGTTQFVSHNVVSPVVKWSGYLAGFQAILREIAGLREAGKREK